MALDINGYNDTFGAFADFAEVMATGHGNDEVPGCEKGEA